MSNFRSIFSKISSAWTFTEKMTGNSIDQNVPAIWYLKDENADIVNNSKIYNFMSTQIFVKIENQKQNIISNLFQD